MKLFFQFYYELVGIVFGEVPLNSDYEVFLWELVENFLPVLLWLCYWSFWERLSPGISLWYCLSFMDIILLCINKMLQVKQILKATLIIPVRGMTKWRKNEYCLRNPSNNNHTTYPKSHMIQATVSIYKNTPSWSSPATWCITCAYCGRQPISWCSCQICSLKW